ncbi:MAG TPA: TldD/PmbA family protein [Candidatus Wallbacteria bacterium]|nr:TldD/PmbA family protein [Candidatus Wallbacteria bacterium]
MKSVIESVFTGLKRNGVSYADIRIVKTEEEEVVAQDGKLDSYTLSSDEGFGIRVFYKGAMGFASSNIINENEIKRVADFALSIARASATTVDKPASLDQQDPIKDKFTTAIEIDPFSVSIDEKVGLLFDCHDKMKSVQGITLTKGFLVFWKTNKKFYSSDGAEIEQTIYESGGGIECYSSVNGDFQKRSFPNSFRGNYGTMGYEYIKSLGLKENSERIARECMMLMSAPQIPSETATLIIGGSQLGLQVHESCGHAIELDRVLGLEASYAGTSFLTLDKKGNFKYGSKIVNITADATVIGGLGSFKYDDEGVPAQRIEIVKEGKFLNYLSSRDTAAMIGERSNGTARASNWNRIPIVRMTNVNLEPGEPSFDELVADTKSGYFIETNRSWSIDDKRVNFQFGCEIAWEIKDGKLGKVFKNPTYCGITPEFWGNCDAICNKNHQVIWGTPNCGKGEPMQSMHVAHRTSPARFRNVRVGVK